MTTMSPPLALPPSAPPHRLDGRRVVVEEPLPLGAGGRRAVGAVRFLRECQSHALTVDWLPDTAELPFAPGLLRHLPPPAPTPGEAAWSAEWRSGHAYGLLYHRRGPDFVTVMDRRERLESARFTLDQPLLLDAFLTVLEPTALDDLDEGGREAVGLLADERLALVSGGWAVALPPRLLRWPVPCTSV